MPANAPHYLIEGGAPLYGEVRLSGAKNAVTKMVMASLLTVEPCILRNVPLLGDLDLAIGLCRDLGAEIDLQDHTLSIRTPHINKVSVSSEIGSLNRMAVLTIGPLIHRCGEADIPMPGGDRIGRRPIDFHLNGLREMGAEIIERDGRYYCSAPRGLHGVTINLPFPSVMATENFLITASLVKGVTIIQNAALEPEIIDLIKLLQNEPYIAQRPQRSRIAGYCGIPDKGRRLPARRSTGHPAYLLEYPFQDAAAFCSGRRGHPLYQRCRTSPAHRIGNRCTSWIYDGLATAIHCPAHTSRRYVGGTRDAL